MQTMMPFKLKKELCQLSRKVEILRRSTSLKFHTLKEIQDQRLEELIGPKVQQIKQ